MIDQTHYGDCRDVLPTLRAQGLSVQCVVTSPPYWGLRDYGVEGQLGLEKTPEEYIANLLGVFRGLRDVLADDGTVWLILGDCYNAYNGGSGPSSKIDDIGNSRNTQRPTIPPGYGLRDKKLKPKDLIGIPWRVALALQATGWWLRSDIIWHKPNPMPESVTDRPTQAHEYIFLLAKSERYYYDENAIREPAIGRTLHDLTGTGYHAPGQPPHTGNRTNGSAGTVGNRGTYTLAPSFHTDEPVDGLRSKRSVWTVPARPYHAAHFATFPSALIEPCILAGARPGDVVLDPFMGSGTTAQVAQALGRRWVGIELDPANRTLEADRTRQRALTLEGAT